VFMLLKTVSCCRRNCKGEKNEKLQKGEENERRQHPETSAGVTVRMKVEIQRMNWSNSDGS
jgi:hypothetical protein